MMDCLLPVPALLAIVLSILVVLAISIPLIRLGGKYGWFESGHIITRKQFEAKVEEAFRGRLPLASEEYYDT